MTLSAYRIVKRRYAPEAFTGEGARRYGGRWNSRGISVVYASESRALAALELLVHIESLEAFVDPLVIFEIQFEPDLMAEPDRIPARWNGNPATQAARRVGDSWFRSQRTAVLRVPSAVVAGDFNYLINPFHIDFPRIVIGRPKRFRLDNRLK